MNAKRLFMPGFVLAMILIVPGAALAQSWQPLTNQPSFGAGTALLLTNGTVMVQDSGRQNWWQLTPDINGSYLNGTWKKLSPLPSGYSPLYFSSAVLRDGRVIVEGGEYNFGVGDWTTLGAIYDPVADVWTSVNPPTGWGTIGDAQNVVLPNGKFLLANCCTTQAAYLNPTTLTWTAAGVSGKIGSNDEEGWTLLPDATVLSVDANNTADLTHSEKYIPRSGQWISAGSTIVQLPDTNSDGSGSHELGPAVLRPDGTVFATGATGHNAIYTPPANPHDPGTWAAGPDFPNLGGQLDVADGPACLLTSGNVLVASSPGVFLKPTHFFEFDGTSLITAPATPNAPNISSFFGRMLMLPNGQVLFTDGSKDVELYTSAGGPSPTWAPSIKSAPTTITAGGSYLVRGTQFNGLSQAVAYGDDAQAATNYPIVRITNQATGHVFYARTHDHSSMGVATGSLVVVTHFDVPAGVELGASNLEVVANGITSLPVTVTVE